LGMPVWPVNGKDGRNAIIRLHALATPSDPSSGGANPNNDLCSGPKVSVRHR
jgi:hypothetical protein